MKKYICLFFVLSGFCLKAQESKDIVDLKSKLDTASTIKTKSNLLNELSIKYYQLQKTDSAIVYVDKMLKSNVDSKDKNFEARINLWMAQLQLMKMNWDKSFIYLTRAEKLLIEVDNYTSLAISNYLFAGYYLFKKDNAKAEEYYKKNIQYFNEGKKIDKMWVLQSYQGLFNNSWVQNNLNNAFQAANTYIDFVKNNFPEKLHEAYYLLGTFYYSSRDYKKSINSLKKSLELNKKDNTLFDANTKTLLSAVYFKYDKIDSAKYYIKDNLNILKDANDPTALAMAYNTLADISEKEKKYDEAENYIKKGIEVSPENDIRQMREANLNSLYSIQVSKLIADSLSLKNSPTKLKELKEAIDNLTVMSSKMEKNINSQYFMHEYYEKLSKGYEYLGNYDLALNYYKQAIQSKEKVYSVDKTREFTDFQADYEMNIQKAQIKLEEETKRLALQKEIELKALKFEYEKKQAAAKTEVERKKLVLEEELKREKIAFKYNEEQKAITFRFNKEKEIAKINQEKKDAIAKAELDSSKNLRNMWALGAVLSLLLFGFAGYSYFQKQKDNKKIAEEKQKSENLLLNILPYEVVEELKLNGESNAKHFDEVSVLFTDFVSFTKMSEKIGVQDMLNELNICFTEFDRIMERNGLEKIKTIGDAYLAVSGLPTQNKNHAKNAVNAGIEILEFIKKRRNESANALEIRIGIHSGAVIAGIVGVKKFAYDIWGDTVNTAARMEQNGVAGMLNISESTFNQINAIFSCEYRGKIETKGKGPLDMYLVKIDDSSSIYVGMDESADKKNKLQDFNSN